MALIKNVTASTSYTMEDLIIQNLNDLKNNSTSQLNLASLSYLHWLNRILDKGFLDESFMYNFDDLSNYLKELSEVANTIICKISNKDFISKSDLSRISLLNKLLQTIEFLNNEILFNFGLNLTSTINLEQLEDSKKLIYNLSLFFSKLEKCNEYIVSAGLDPEGFNTIMKNFINNIGEADISLNNCVKDEYIKKLLKEGKFSAAHNLLILLEQLHYYKDIFTIISDDSNLTCTSYTATQLSKFINSLDLSTDLSDKDLPEYYSDDDIDLF